MHGRFCVLVLLAACTTGDNAFPSSLVATVVEPPGVNCADGGVAVESGRDRNDNGVLDPSEVTAISYVCAPPGPAQPVVAVESEPAGAHCANGGEAINTGLDLNDNGVLDANEITQTTYICNATNPEVLEGSFTVHNAWDAVQLLGVREVSGDLTIDAVGLTDIDLTSLVTVDGDFVMINFDGPTLALPELVTARRLFQIRPVLTSVLLDKLTTGGQVEISAESVTAPSLASVQSLYVTGLTTDISLPAFVQGTLHFETPGVGVALPTLVSDTSILATCDHLEAPKLETVGTLALDSTSSVNLPALTSATTVGIGFSTMTSFPFAQLTTLGSVVLNANTNAIAITNATTSLDTLSIYNGPAVVDLPNLTTVSRLDIESAPFATFGLPALQAVGSLFFVGDQSLSAFAFPSLTSAGLVGIWNNPVLSTCAAQAFAAALHPTTTTIMNNGPC